MKKLKTIGIWTFLLVLLIINCYAIGLAPSRTIIDFESNLEKTINMKIINNENRIVFAKLYVKGDLKDFIELPQIEFKLQPNEIKSFSIDLKFPSDFDKPGINDNRIGIVETSDPSQKGGAMIGAVAGVESQLWVDVPYKEKYVQASLTATNAKVGENVKFTLTLSNQGIFDLNQVSAILKIYDLENNFIRTLKTDSVLLKKQASTSFELTMDSTGLPMGKYKVVAEIQYDELTKKIETGFKIGDFLIKINKLEIAPIEQGNIGEILVHLENFWPETINKIGLKLQLKKDNNMLDIIDIGPHSIAAWENKIIPIYWKSGDNQVGDYQASMIATYGDKKAEAEQTFKIIEKVSKGNNFRFLLLPLVILLISGIIIYTMIFSVKIKFK